jgi:hypothetical protein
MVYMGDAYSYTAQACIAFCLPNTLSASALTERLVPGIMDWLIKFGEVSEWLMVPLSKSGLGFSERGFESHPLRFTINGSVINGEVLEWPIRHAWRACVAFGYRGFESHPLRFIISPTLISNSS